ncbi:hypothetical protein DVA86_20550 [Streptomyces armeniacus]|uniref:Uncharacterized protein n=1 Tax=Streptomyces armeniacus TaxID=83291 RepID=A0A345XSR9_9ACTN|nr:hypothetical protein [Streptomyces armeniacus]AXK34685.1 hypothetical protein DVA86_20550 [Streptomyces armeniacus]
MPENNNRWTSDHLMKPGGTALYGAQQRARLRQMADEVRVLLREYRADLENVEFDGDKPFEPRIRAFLASRPLAQFESDLRAAVKHVGKLDSEYQRRYVELPEKRKVKAIEKAHKKGIKTAQSLNTAEQLNAVSQTPGDNNGQAAKKSEEPSFLDFLEKRA